MSPAAAAADVAGRRRILEAATERFARDGTIQTRLTDIQADAGVSIGAIYHHFRDKQALAEATVEYALGRYQEEFLAELERHEDPRAGIRAIVAFHLAWCERHPGSAKLLSRGAAPAASELNDAFFERVLRWYRRGIGGGQLRRLPIRTLYALWLGPATVIVRDRLDAGGREPTHKEVEVLCDAAWQALSAGSGIGGRR